MYGTVNGEDPPKLHRQGVRTGFTQRMQPITIVSEPDLTMPICERCTMFDGAGPRVLAGGP